MFGLDDIYFLRNIKQRRKEEEKNIIDITTNEDKVEIFKE